MNAPERLVPEVEDTDSDRVKPGPLDRLTATYFGIPAAYLPDLDQVDLGRHKAVVLFTCLIVLPLSAIAFGHLAVLVAGDGSFFGLTPAMSFWTLAVTGGVFGVILSWLNNSGTTIVLRSPGSSWQKFVGVLVRMAFIALNVTLFTAAIVTFSLRSQLDAERQKEESRQIQASRSNETNALKPIRDRILLLEQQLKALVDTEMKQEGMDAIALRPKYDNCQKEARNLKDRIGVEEGKLKSNQIDAANELSPRRNAATSEVRRLNVSLKKLRADLSTNNVNCRALEDQINEARKKHLDAVYEHHTNLTKSLGLERTELERLISKVNEAADRSSRLAKTESNRSLGSELLALYRVVFPDGSNTANGDRVMIVTATVVALFVGLIDLMPVVLGWSLKDKAVDAHLESQTRLSIGKILENETLAGAYSEQRVKAERAYLEAKNEHEGRVLARRAVAEAELESARLYADSVTRLEIILRKEGERGASESAIAQVRSDALETLRQLYQTRENAP